MTIVPVVNPLLASFPGRRRRIRLIVVLAYYAKVTFTTFLHKRRFYKGVISSRLEITHL